MHYLLVFCLFYMTYVYMLFYMYVNVLWTCDRYFMVLYDVVISSNQAIDARRSSMYSQTATSPLAYLHSCIHTDGGMIIETMQKHAINSYLGKLSVKQMFSQLLVI